MGTQVGCQLVLIFLPIVSIWIPQDNKISLRNRLALRCSLLLSMADGGDGSSLGCLLGQIAWESGPSLLFIWFQPVHTQGHFTRRSHSAQSRQVPSGNEGHVPKATFSATPMMVSRTCSAKVNFLIGKFHRRALNTPPR